MNPQQPEPLDLKPKAKPASPASYGYSGYGPKKTDKSTKSAYGASGYGKTKSNDTAQIPAKKKRWGIFGGG